MSPAAKKTAPSAAKRNKPDTAFTAEERAAMKERAKELKAEARANKDRDAGEQDLLAKIAEMPKADRVIAQRLHAIMQTAAPELMPKTWYGMPAYARDGKVLVFFQAASKFGSRYATLGFTDKAALDDGAMWATSYGLSALSDKEEQAIRALIEKAIRP